MRGGICSHTKSDDDAGYTNGNAKKSYGNAKKSYGNAYAKNADTARSYTQPYTQPYTQSRLRNLALP